MERYQVILAYDGSQFQGFQRQARAYQELTSRSVQGVVETALRKVGWQGKSILAAGRTDTGVHALGQVIAFDLEWKHTPQALQNALNAHLPTDVAVQRVQPVHPDFHPRFDAVGRRYRYQLYCRPTRHPLLDHYAWRVWPAVELPLMQQAASFLVGRHDFAAFGTPPHSGGSTVRTIFEAGWEEVPPHLVFDIHAQAFLYHMVRRLVYVQVMIGQGRLAPEALAISSMESPRSIIYGLAPPQGLTLVEVDYAPQAQ
jgi:tRNA pseudouridine38-40 synthase